jgi:hypothetical protein
MGKVGAQRIPADFTRGTNFLFEKPMAWVQGTTTLVKVTLPLAVPRCPNVRQKN